MSSATRGVDRCPTDDDPPVTPGTPIAGPAVRRGRLAWMVARVLLVWADTARASRLVLDVPGWVGHLPGQHLDVRLTALDGYQAQRSYSIASAPERPHIEQVVQTLPGGEVSPYLTGELRAGDQIEVRVRTLPDVIAADRIDATDARVTLVLTRHAPDGWSGPTGRVEAQVLREHVLPPAADPQVFVCGPTGFVEPVAGALVELGHPPAKVKTECFGDSGGPS